MVEAQHSTLSGIDGEVRGRTAGAEERLPIPQAAAIMVTLSLALWALIGLGVSWLVG
ncbi:MAG TPA: hypothetical protein VF606_00725 [Geminicoccaceae bacterium]